jgi:hypothetical protein
VEGGIVIRQYFSKSRLVLILCGSAFLLSACGTGEIVFSDVRAQTRQFMEWERTIQLTPEQESLKKAALGSIPAPCCSDNSAYTCCCPCNVSRTIWGLTNYMISEQEAGVDKIQAKVKEWVRFVNPAGYSGDTCYTGGCPRPFKNNGCGGMKQDQVAF